MIEQLLTILSLQSGYNTAVVLLATTMLGVAASVVGVFLFLRKRAMISDAVAHATLPGIALAFLLALAVGWADGRHLPTLLAGAALAGLAGAWSIQWIRDNTRLPEDTAIGSVLSVFYGLGIVLLSYIQAQGEGAQAGLDSFLIGQVAAINLGEAVLIGGVSLAGLVVALLVRNHLALLCFDAEFADSLTGRARVLDMVMNALMLVIVCVGLRTVGLILILALLIMPGVTARLWTDRLNMVLLAAALIGGVSCYVGAALSALLPGMPAGGIIVLTAAGFFCFSILFAPRRGIFASFYRQILDRPYERGGDYS